VYRYLRGRPLTRDETAADMARWERHWAEHGFGLLAIDDRETGALIGRSGLAYHKVWPTDPEVGWKIDPARWGQGLATEAGAACIRWGFGELGFERLVSICLPGNAASRRVMAKLGLRVVAECDSEHGQLLIHALERELDAHDQ
jgi:RimJ/RimL family protein N-acetyltransferase